MCGIAGIIDLAERRPVPHGVLQAMAAAIIHRGPDEEGFLERPGLGLASRRLSIVGLADGRQPIFNEDRSIAVVYNGELFDYPEMKAELEQRGHRFATHCDTELMPHLWEEAGEAMFEKLRVPILGVVENMGQFLCPHCGKASEIFSRGGGQTLAEKYGVPLLGSVPLDPLVCETGESGKPVSASKPDSAPAKAFREIARKAAAAVSVRAAQSKTLEIKLVKS